MHDEIRREMILLGCKTIKEFGIKSSFVQITSAGVKENHPHEVKIIKEAPN